MLSSNQLVKRLQNGNIRGIIFDFDGTILDIRESLHNAVDEVYQKKNISADIETTIQEIGALMETIQSYPLPKIVLESYEMFKYISSLHSISYLKKLQIAAEIFTKYLSYAKEANFYPEALEFLRKYKKKFDFFIISHNQTKNIFPHLERNKVKSYFKLVNGADLLPALKPDPKALSPVFESYKSCKLNEFVIIGDMPSDIIAGNEAGIYTIAVASGVSNHEILADANPSLLIDSLNDLDNLIENKGISESNHTSLKIKS